MGPKNGIIGEDANYGTDLPVTGVDPDEQDAEMIKTAKFSKTAEYQTLKKYLESRMDFYRVYMPDGTPVVASKLTPAEKGQMWIAANVIIGEFKAILDVYDNAAEQVKDAATRRKRI